MPIRWHYLGNCQSNARISCHYLLCFDECDKSPQLMGSHHRRKAVLVPSEKLFLFIFEVQFFSKENTTSFFPGPVQPPTRWWLLIAQNWVILLNFRRYRVNFRHETNFIYSLFSVVHFFKTGSNLTKSKTKHNKIIYSSETSLVLISSCLLLIEPRLQLKGLIWIKALSI